MSHNPAMRESLARARALGCTVEQTRRGVVKVRHAESGQSNSVDAGRKDTPRSLLVMLRAVEDFHRQRALEVRRTEGPAPTPGRAARPLPEVLMGPKPQPAPRATAPKPIPTPTPAATAAPPEPKREEPAMAAAPVVTLATSGPGRGHGNRPGTYRPVAALEPYVEKWLAEHGGFRRGNPRALYLLLEQVQPALLVDQRGLKVTESWFGTFCKLVDARRVSAEAAAAAAKPATVAQSPDPALAEAVRTAREGVAIGSRIVAAVFRLVERGDLESLRATAELLEVAQ